jgi:hypothetical protein
VCNMPHSDVAATDRCGASQKTTRQQDRSKTFQEDEDRQKSEAANGPQEAVAF